MDKVACPIETNPYLLYIFRKPNSYFFLGGNGTSTTSVSLLLQETTKLSSSKDDIKIDIFLIDRIIFFKRELIISMYCSFASSAVR
jgi:hypothetical protein